jgi:hypothetical protein
MLLTVCAFVRSGARFFRQACPREHFKVALAGRATTGMSDAPETREVRADPSRVKRAVLVFYADQILIECPFCGKTLIRTNYQRIQRLLHIEGTTRAKECPKCGKLAALLLNSQAKKLIAEKMMAEETP